MDRIRAGDEFAGEIVGAEFVRMQDVDAGTHEQPGTFITVLLDEDPPIAAGRVKIIYLPLDQE